LGIENLLKKEKNTTIINNFINAYIDNDFINNYYYNNDLKAINLDNEKLQPPLENSFLLEDFTEEDARDSLKYEDNFSSSNCHKPSYSKESDRADVSHEENVLHVSTSDKNQKNINFFFNINISANKKNLKRKKMDDELHTNKSHVPIENKAKIPRANVTSAPINQNFIHPLLSTLPTNSLIYTYYKYILPEMIVKYGQQQSQLPVAEKSFILRNK